MSGQAPGTAGPGWYDDPAGTGGQRWWDGAAWTEHTGPAAGRPGPAVHAPQPRNGHATAGFVLGIVSMVGNPLAVISVIGLVLSFVGLSRANRLGEHGYAPVGRKRAIWGLVLSGLALLFTGTLKAFLF
jgi:hypothetical protein